MSDFLNKFTQENYEETIDKKDLKPKKDKKDKKEKKEKEEVSHRTEVTQRREFVEETFKDPNYKKQQKTKWVLMAISLIILVSLSIFGYIWMNRVRVIDFVNQPISDLQTWAARNDLVVQVEEVYSLEVSDNYIIEMTPVGGSTLSKGDLINVVVSMGADPEEILQVPDFTDSSSMDIQTWIDQVQANNMRISYEYSDKVTSDLFLRIKFNDDTTTNDNYQRKDYAIIYISRGPEIYEKNIDVPNWVVDKATLSTAQTWATTNVVKLVINYVYSNLAIDSIVAQSVPAKTMVAKNDSITISVSKGVSVVVPDFKLLNMNDALSEVSMLDALENVSVDLIKMYNNTNVYGSYIWQDQNAGIKIDASLAKPFEMRVYYSLGQPFIDSQVGSLESVLTSYFYNLNLNSAELSYSVAYKDCTSISDPIKGQICYQSRYNEYVNTGSAVEFIVHDPSATITY